MAKRKRIALCYTYNENWIGGTYYIENLVSALNALDDADKPHIVLLTNRPQDQKAAESKLNYPYITFQLGSGESNSFFQLVNKVSGRLMNYKPFNQTIKNLDAVFPYYKCVQQSGAKKKFYWIADFQEHFVPDFFSTDTIQGRRKSQEEIQTSTENLILSSNDAFQNFKSIYPQHKVKVDVLPFAVTHPKFEHLDIASLLEKYKLPQQYFMCPNQFWRHKNQVVVIKAVHELKQKGVEITVAFTGNTIDPGEYLNYLLEYIKENNLGDNIKFLGFIPRDEQLQLMNHSTAIIQPSLFEGWSTVVEDAKSLNKYLLVSDINIHLEQLVNSSAQFFDPHNSQELSKLLKETAAKTSLPPLYEKNDYSDKVKAFGENFLKIVL